MDESGSGSLEERVDRLEQSVEQLRRTLQEFIQIQARRAGAAVPPRQPIAPTRPTASPAPATTRPTVPPVAPRPVRTEVVPTDASPPWYADRGAQYWLNKIGIGLVLFGVAFLFKYSVDQGWLSQQVRVAIALTLGAGLFALGTWTHPDRPWFGRVLLGGAIATFYITGYAAFQLYHLMSYPVAFAFMVGVSVLAFFAALRQDEAVLSVIGVLGALATPFVLFTGSSDVARLASYTSLVLAGAAAVFLVRGWRSLLWVAVVGGWAVLLAALDAMSAGAPPATRGVLQLAAIVCLIAFWAVPVVRERLRHYDPERWPVPDTGPLDRTAPVIAERHVHLLTVVTPLAVLWYSTGVWTLPIRMWGWIAVLGAAGFAVATWTVDRWRAGERLAFAHAVAAASLLTVGAGLLLEGSALLLAWGVEVAALHLVARRTGDRPTAIGGHVLFVVVVSWLAVRLVVAPYAGGWPVAPTLSAAALTDLGVVALIVGASLTMERANEAMLYRLVAYAALAAWFARGLSDGPLMLALAAEAAVLHWIARRYGDRATAVAAHVLFAAVAVQLAGRLVAGSAAGVPAVNRDAAANLAVIATVLWCGGLLADGEQRLYRVAAHVAFLAWLWHELSALPNGSGFVTLAWGSYAIALMIVALLRQLDLLRNVALATLLLVVAKLFLVDLARVGAIWRIMLFLGFGGLFLALSYYFRDLWQRSAPATDD